MSKVETYEGFLKTAFVNAGSKSEHRAVVLQTANGDEFKLNVKGLNPFSDPALDAYVGRYAEVRGTIIPHTPYVLHVEKFFDIAIKKGPAL